MFSDHLKTCDYCRGTDKDRTETPKLKPTIKINMASKLKPTIKIASSRSYQKKSKLAELAAMIKGTAGPSFIQSQPQPKGASSSVRKPGYIERKIKLKELGKMIKGS
jgi:thioredoxin-related protein